MDVGQAFKESATGHSTTLLFLHGFPATSHIWHHQVAYFQARNFGVIAPDLLGCGGSDKPLNPRAYSTNLVCRDLVEILQAERANRVIAIGHDIGSKIVSRLANLYETLFIGYGFLAVPYSAPDPTFTLEHALSATLHQSRRTCGYELCGHLAFYAEPGADKIIEDKIASFYSAMFPEDNKMWVSDVAPLGALRKWLEADKCSPLPLYITEEDTKAWHEAYSRKSIFEASLCWYKAITEGFNADEEKAIPLHKYSINQPVFFGAANHDYISRSIIGIASTNRTCQNATIREFQAGRWLMLSHAKQVNEALYTWIMDVV